MKKLVKPVSGDGLIIAVLGIILVVVGVFLPTKVEGMIAILAGLICLMFAFVLLSFRQLEYKIRKDIRRESMWQMEYIEAVSDNLVQEIRECHNLEDNQA